MKEQIIRLDEHDDIGTVRDKLAWIRTKRVLLVFPTEPGVRILDRRLDLVLLQREVTRKKANLALITRDPVVREHAAELGIPAFKTVKASQRQRWHTARADLKIADDLRPHPLTSELIDAGTRLQTDSLIPPHIRRWATISIVSTTALAVIGVALFFVPSAVVFVQPATNQASVTVPVTARSDGSITSPQNNQIPSRLVGIEVEGSATIETSGSAQVPSSKATGVALFTNLLPQQVTIPTGTIVRTSAAQPVRFTTLSDATLPGQIGDTIEVAIEALEPGFIGNLPGARINQIEGPLSSAVAVTNPTATRGGDAVEVAAVAEEDFERVRSQLLQQLQQRAFAELQTDPLINLSTEEFIPIETLTVVLIQNEDYDSFVGQTTDTLTLSMHITVQGIAVDERVARQVVYALLAERVGDGFQIEPDTLIFRRGEIADWGEGYVTFVMQGAGDVVTSVDAGEIRNLTRARTVNDAQVQLDRELPLSAPARIETWPPFWPFTPLVPLRIQVVVEKAQ